MKDYQGIGAAVNMHLARFGVADREIASARRLLDKRDADALAGFARHPWGRNWTTFGGSYGVPGRDGKPMANIVTVEEATITGREQYAAEGIAAFQGAGIGIREHDMLSKAVSHYVSGEIVDEVTEAALLAGPEPLFHTDLFTPFGFALLEKPLIVPDLDGDLGVVSETETVPIRAFAWSTAEMTSMSLIDSTDPADLQLRPGITIWLYSTAADMDIPPEDLTMPDLFPVEVAPWMFGKSWEPRNVNYSMPGTVPVPVAYERRWFLAFMRLCWQEIIVRHPYRPDRAQSRRWERFSKRKELLDYTVLRLRREVDPNYRPTGEGAPLDHRVVVRGHWKRQHFPSLGVARMPDGAMNPESHRLIWVERHIRGHEFLPMGAEHSATSVVR